MFDAYTPIAKLNPNGRDLGVDADVGLRQWPQRHQRSASWCPAATTCHIRSTSGPAAMPRTSSTRPSSARTCWWRATTRTRTRSTSSSWKGSWADESAQVQVRLCSSRTITRQLRSFTDLPYTWQMYAGYGPPPVGTGGVAPIPANLISSTFGTGSNFINGWGNGGNLPPAIIAANGYAILNYLQSLNGAGHERRRLQQPGRCHALHRQIHHVSECRRDPRTSPRTRCRRT